MADNFGIGRSLFEGGDKVLGIAHGNQTSAGENRTGKAGDGVGKLAYSASECKENGAGGGGHDFV
jgi:hypothetical protein